MTTKKELNELKAKQRLERLQAEQKEANELKKQFGYTGTPSEIIKKHRIATAVQESERKAQLVTAAKAELEQYVTDALNGPSQRALKNWLVNREPTYERVKRFFDERPAQQRIKQVWVAPEAVQQPQAKAA